MFPKPHASLTPNTFAFEELPLVKPTGFREYDARWLYPQEINLMGVQPVDMLFLVAAMCLFSAWIAQKLHRACD